MIISRRDTDMLLFLRVKLIFVETSKTYTYFCVGKWRITFYHHNTITNSSPLEK